MMFTQVSKTKLKKKMEGSFIRFLGELENFKREKMRIDPKGHRGTRFPF